MTIGKPAYNGSPGGSGAVYVRGIDPLKSTTLKVVRSAVTIFSSGQLAGPVTANLSAGSLAPGDQVVVEQPTGSPQETYTVPEVSAAGTAGSPTVTGHAPAGSVGLADYQSVCWTFDSDAIEFAPQGSAFSVNFPAIVMPGQSLELTILPGKGDRIRYRDRVPGESPCITADAFLYPTWPGDTPSTTPYSIRATGFRPDVATGARIALRRGASLIADYSDPVATSSITKDLSVRPQPGDVVEVYRPHTAPSPTATFPIPAVTSIYDPGNSLEAIDAPPAFVIESETGSMSAMWGGSRGALNTPAGRTILNFGAAEGANPAISLGGVDWLGTSWYSPNRVNYYSINSTLGDLTAPTIKAKLASKFRLPKIKSSIAVQVTSTEAASAKLTLTLPAKLKTSKAKSPTVVASTSVSLKAGSNKLKLKVTKAGKKLLKSIRKRKLPTQKATLTVTATDASGNAATKVVTTKLVNK